MRILLVLALFLPLAAQQPDSDGDYTPTSVYIAVQSSATGNVTFSVTPITEDEHQTSVLLDVVPQAIGCQWTGLRRTRSTLNGVCRGWLVPEDGSSTANLQLGPLAKALYDQGADTVSITLEVRGGAEVSAPEGWIGNKAKTGRSTYFTFEPEEQGDVPPNFPIPIEPPKPVNGLLIPMLIVLFAPGLLAYAIRLRATDASAGQKVNWIVWMNWINLAAWLYWISAINISDLAEALMRAGLTSYFAALGLGVAIYAFPPLIAVASCLCAMAPLLSSSPENFSLLLKRRIVAEASIIVPLGIFLVGSGLSVGRGYYATFSLVGAYLVYRSLAWISWSMSYRETTPLESGPLFDRATALARKAGVTISRLAIIQTKVPEEANAFASSGGKVTLTESLVRGLTPREVDAVIAHELGHHKSGHLRFNLPQLLFWVYIIGAGPLFGWLTSQYHLPSWLMTVPMAPILFIALQGTLSQKREFAADARAAEITGDPEGKIAALARLSQLSRMPIQDGGIMGSIMSHPSMEKRVLALARGHNIPDFRALAILTNPDEAYDGAVVRPVVAASAQPEQPADKPAFTLREKAILLEQLRWWNLLGPLLGAGLIAAAGPNLFIPSRALVLWTLGVGPLVILLFTLVVEVLWQGRFERRMHRTIARRLNQTLPATFVGIHPGRGVRYTEALPDWDFGFLSLEGDWLCYRGDKVRFAIPRQEVRNIGIVKGPRTWLREHRAEVVFAGGSFTINASFAHPSMATAQRTLKWIREWTSQSASTEPAGARPEPPPLLPNLPGMNTSRSSVIWYVCKTTLKLWVVGPLAVMAGFNTGFTVTTIMFVAPAAAVLRVLPAMIWPIRRPRAAVAVPRANPVSEGAPSFLATDERR